jgi:hypothetical protein
VIEVRADGTVWKLRNLKGTSAPVPRRADRKMANGYFAVYVWRANRQYGVLAHRLAWTVTHGPIPPRMEINHKDGNPANNRLENLELVTSSENNLHSYRTLGRKAPKSLPAPILAQVAPRAKALRAEGLTFAEIGRRLGIAQTTAFRATRLP